MKRKVYFLIAAFATLSVASCIQDQFESFGPESSVGVKEFTVTLNPFTRTALDEGKTVWAEGDQILVTNGVANDTIDVPDEVWGLKDFTFKTENATPTEENPKVYVIYPVSVAKKIVDGNIVVNVPGVQEGTFASANICVGESEGESVALRNITGVLKVSVPEETQAPIYQLVFTASGNTPLCGECTVDLSGEKPVLSVNGPGSSVVLQAGGFDGDFYAAVIPGSYDAGFKLTAATVNFEYASETKTSTAANVVNVNEIVDLGEIGTNLQPLNGDGTKGNPFQLENLGHMIALSSAVDNGDESETFEGQYFKVMNDISGVSTPVGSSAHPFCGDFDGNNKSIIINLGGTANYVGLFSRLSNGANIHNLVIEGSVDVNGQGVGALVGGIDCDETTPRVIVKDVVNLATVKGTTRVGGLAGYADYVDFTDCSNNATVEANNSVGGIVGYAYQITATSCINTKSITGKTDGGKVVTLQAGAWGTAMSNLDGSSGSSYSSIPTNGVGGIAGWAQNSTMDGCENRGSIEAVSKAGGIAGALYWSTVKYSTNKAEVFAQKDFVGGIAGWNYTSGSNLYNTNTGTVIGRAAVGGIVGMTNGGTSNAVCAVRNCSNSGDIISDYTTATGAKFYNYSFGNVSAAGGIVGLAVESSNGSNRGVTQVSECINDGTVTGKGQGVGGICGMRASFLNNVQTGYIDKSVNNGDVTGKLYRAGGIIGICFGRFEAEIFEIRNCANHGTVQAPYVVAGIASWISTAYPASAATTNECIRNCYNDGTILYDKNAYADGSGPYAGGILGYSQKTWVHNVINYGEVKPTEGEPNEYDSKYLASALAFLGKCAAADYVYAFDTEMPIVGPNTGTPEATVGATAEVLEDGTFDASVTVGGVACDNPVDALNQWILAVTNIPENYVEWVQGVVGPEFAE